MAELSFSEQRAVQIHDAGSCRFQSCTEYVRRVANVYVGEGVPNIYSDWREFKDVAWPEGAEEDELVFKIDAFEAEMKVLEANGQRWGGVWTTLNHERCRTDGLLTTRLVARFYKDGKI